MLTEDEIRSAIVARVEACAGPSNRGLIDHTDGVLRGLLWALTAEDPGPYVMGSMQRVFRLAGIPFVEEGQMIHYGADNPRVLAAAAAEGVKH